MRPETTSGMGATDIACMCGRGYKSPLQLWLEKTGKALPTEPTDAMKRGSRAERYITERYEEVAGVVTDAAPVLYHAEYPFLWASPDRITLKDTDGSGDVRFVELKSHRFYCKDEYGAQYSDAVPDREVIQTTWQAHLGVQNCVILAPTVVDLFVSFGWDDEGLWHVPYDPTFGAELEQRAVRFWTDNVLADIPPDVSGSEDDSAWLNNRLRGAARVEVALPAEHEATVGALKSARAELAAWKGAVDLHTNTLKQLLADANATDLRLPDGQVITCRTSKDTLGMVCDIGKLRVDLPEVYDQYVTKRVVRYGSPKFTVPRSWKGED